MSDDRFLERLRDDARALRYEPDDNAIWTRLPAKIRARLHSSPASASQLLAAWFRPIAASLTAIALAATMGLAWFEQPRDTTTSETISANGVDIMMDGDSYRVGD
jgi:hypothetical protein